ncbi:NHL repeat containing protein [Beggiatoa sp. PS]|nr:NHL repeat containing protein [Beggiatoa sp. PS]
MRNIRLHDATTNTLIGNGLFVFGDKDGIGTQARLQHALGVVWDNKRQGLWIADTYNSKIRWMALADQQVVHRDIDCTLDEPGGLSLFEDTLWIANTNSHQIVRYDIHQNKCHLNDD